MWHRRLGHVGFGTLAKMSSLNMLTGSTLKPAHFLQARSEPWEICIVTKQLAQPHTSPTSNPATEPSGRMFADITGNPTEGFNVTMLDQFTTWAAASQVAHKSAEDVLEFVSTLVKCWKLRLAAG